MVDKQDQKTTNLQRKLAAVRVHTVDLIAKNANLRHEIKRLNDTLAWIHRTGQPIEEIRRVIEKTIPNRLKERDKSDG